MVSLIVPKRRTNKNHIGAYNMRIKSHLITNMKGQSIVGLYHDNDGFWYTNFSTMKQWNKIPQKQFDTMVKTYKKSDGVMVFDDVQTLIRF